MSITTNTRPLNGVSYGIKHTVTAAEAADGTIIFDFQNSQNLVVALIEVTDSINESLPLPGGLIITYPAVGQISLGGFSWSAGDVIHLIASNRRDV